MSLLSRAIVLVTANVLLLLACVIFASGFFPYKPFLPGLAEYNTAEYGSPPAAPFNKVVFMVVDALRSDFVFGSESGFSFTQGLIRNGYALPFTAHATAPTVTMPRVKAITTGSIPSFLDMILNFAESDTTSSLAHQDTWLAQMKAKKGGKLIMYGDDTWLKLFPDVFDRADGTSSFFVSDFTEVDNNVTRHVPDELKKEDWTVMIMHYLGMDHIGHKSGPRSVNMLPKQREMDGIVEKVYNAIDTSQHLSSTLFVLCGDHGMNEGGNHGGSAPGETSPALVFLSPKFSRISKGLPSPIKAKDEFEYYTKIEQSDIAPTLAGLLGFPIPLNNLGVFIAQFLPLWSTDRDRIHILLQNAAQMLQIAKATFPHPFWEDPKADIHCRGSLSSADKLACAWREVNSTLRASRSAEPPAEMIMPFLVYFCKTAQELLSSTASNYNLPHMFLGLALAGSSAVLSLYNAAPLFAKTSMSSNLAFTIVNIGYGVMMFASSYVEEEQQFWYWACSGWFMLLVIKGKSKIGKLSTMTTSLLPLLSLRLLRRWNQSGQKFAGAPDIASFFRKDSSSALLLWTLVLLTYLYLFIRILSSFRQTDLDNIIGRLWAAVICAGSLAFKVAFTWNDEPELVERLVAVIPAAGQRRVMSLMLLDLVFAARMVYLCIGVAVVYVVLLYISGAGQVMKARQTQRLSSTILPLLTTALLLQTRLTNIPTFLLLELLRVTVLSPNVHSNSTSNPPSSLVTTTLSVLLLTHSAYFANGGTNTISSLDLSLAYNGIASFNAPLVGLLLFIGNWAGPIYFAIAGLDGVLSKVSPSTSSSSSSSSKLSSATTKKEANTSTYTSTDTENMHMHISSKWDIYTSYITLLTLFLAAATLSTMAACSVLRTHLFVWTVFSPKFLYTVAWLVGWHLGVNVVVGGALTALS